ncbi:MAG: acyl-CoA dehydrogenase family protein [Pseudomonadales bacterium]
MEFSFSEEQLAIRDLAKQIFSDKATDDYLRQYDFDARAFDGELWQTLAEAGLLGITLPESCGGSAMGLTELCLALEEYGRALAPVPMFSSLVLAALPLSEFGSEVQQSDLLQPLANGKSHLASGLHSADAYCELQAQEQQGKWTLNGSSGLVAYAEEAAALVLPAKLADGSRAVFALPYNTKGISLTPQFGTNLEPLYKIHFDNVAVGNEALLGSAQEGEKIIQWAAERAMTALAAMQVGVLEEGLRRTAEYTGERQQFGRPMASFQAVSHRAANGYIDIEALRSAYWLALWRLSEGLPASKEVRVAKWWACEAGHRVGHTGQHLHGGIGSDVDYPIHRYYLWAKQIEFTLGGANRQLADLGAMLAANEEVQLPV